MSCRVVVVVGAPFGLSGRIGSSAGRDPEPGFATFIDAQHQRAIRGRDRADECRASSTNSGSVDSLKRLLRCGCSENACQMRRTSRPTGLTPWPSSAHSSASRRPAWSQGRRYDSVICHRDRAWRARAGLVEEPDETFAQTDCVRVT